MRRRQTPTAVCRTVPVAFAGEDAGHAPVQRRAIVRTKTVPASAPTARTSENSWVLRSPWKPGLECRYAQCWYAVKEGPRLADQPLIFFPGRMTTRLPSNRASICSSTAARPPTPLRCRGCPDRSAPRRGSPRVVFVLVVLIEVQQQINMQGS